jgi:GntR family transcriptional regulator, carbon starvation induced regulator
MSMTDQAYETPKRDILSGALRPDEALTVAMLTARFGFGWTTVRGSPSRLKGENLVMLVCSRGCRMATVSIDELCDIHRARLTVEARLLCDPVRKGDGERQERAQSRAPVQQTGMSEVVHETFGAAHREFHFTLVGGTDSLLLSRFQEQFCAQVCRHQRLLVFGCGSLSNSRTDTATLTTLHSASATVHHTQLLGADLDPDELRVLGPLQDHIGAVQGAPQIDLPA